jgi:hypothetical protein
VDDRGAGVLQQRCRQLPDRGHRLDLRQHLAPPHDRFASILADEVAMAVVEEAVRESPTLKFGDAVGAIGLMRGVRSGSICRASFAIASLSLTSKPAAISRPMRLMIPIRS